jgi:S1-C subfamily serine protease
VGAGTPAARAGLRAGDVILELDETPVNDLRDYAQVLRQLKPGDALVIRYQRNGSDTRTTARVAER